jgi:hypothetical protein
MLSRSKQILREKKSIEREESMPFVLKFDRTGLLGLVPPATEDSAELAHNYEFMRRIAFAVQDFGARIKEIEVAYQEVIDQDTT